MLEIWEFDIDEESNPKFFLFQEDPQAVQEDGGLLSDSIVTDPVFGAKTHALLFLIPPTNWKPLVTDSFIDWCKPNASFAESRKVNRELFYAWSTKNGDL